MALSVVRTVRPTPVLLTGFDRQLDRQFDQLARAFFGPQRSARRAWAPVDVATTDEAYTVTVELPGVKREDITVELTDDTLTVRSERAEVRRGVPADVDGEAVAASLADGVLTVTLPRQAAPAPRQIEITAA